jgi:hypothetical protein
MKNPAQVFFEDGIKNREKGKMLLVSFALTLLTFASVYWQFGFHFEASDAIVFFGTKTDITNPDIPINYNEHIYIISKLIKLQHAFPNISVFGIYCAGLLFIAHWIICFFAINKKNVSLTSRLFTVLLLGVFLADNYVNMHNSRISIMLLIAYCILLHKAQNWKSHLASLSLLVLACLVRVEYGFIFAFLLGPYMLLFRTGIQRYQWLSTLTISVVFIGLLIYELDKSDELAKMAFAIEREIIEKQNVIPLSPDDEDYEKKQTYREALSYFLEDRDYIQPESYLRELQYKTPKDYFLSYAWMPIYLKRLKDTFCLFLNHPFYFAITLLALIITISIQTFRHIIFALFLVLFPFIVAFQAEMVARFFMPYIASFPVIYLSVRSDYFRSKRWLFILLASFMIIPVLLAGEKKLSARYEEQQANYEELDRYYQRKIDEGYRIIHSNFFYEYYMSPNIFWNRPVARQYFISISFWHYYESFRATRGKIFTDQSSIVSNLNDIATQPNIIFISTNIYMTFLQKYLHHFHKITLDFEVQEEVLADLNAYRIMLYPQRD